MNLRFAIGVAALDGFISLPAVLADEEIDKSLRALKSPSPEDRRAEILRALEPNLHSPQKDEREMMATSDLPGGVVNLLTGTRADTLPTFATHAHLRAVYAVANKDERTEIQRGAAEHVKRTIFLNSEKPTDWFSEKSQGLYHIRHFLEPKTTWHPVGA